MTTTEEMQDLGREMGNLLRRDMPEVQHMSGLQDGHAYWNLVNRLAHALNGAKPLCFSGQVISDETGEIELACLTEDRVIHAKGQATGGDLEVSTVSRSRLTRLDVLSAPAVITGGGFGTRYFGAYRLTYADGPTFTLPVNTARPMNALEEIVPSLLDDLHR